MENGRYKFTKDGIVDTKSYGYKLGQIFLSTVILCVLAIIIAFTAKFIIWMF